jgi:hypothetical protein
MTDEYRAAGAWGVRWGIRIGVAMLIIGACVLVLVVGIGDYLLTRQRALNGDAALHKLIELGAFAQPTPTPPSTPPPAKK